MEQLYALFAEVARQGSIRKAADRLGLSAASVSRHIARLEHSLDAPLLDRRTDGVRLTPAGELLLRFIADRTRELERLRAAINELKAVERGHVSLFTVEGMLGGFIPGAIATFARLYPGITHELVVAGTDNVVAAVAEDRCDIGIAFQPQPRGGVTTVAQMRQPVLAVVGAGHPLAGRHGITMADLADEPLCLPDKTFGIRQAVDRAAKRAGITALHMETNSIDMMRHFALTGMGVTFMPAFAFEREAAAGSLVGIAIADPNLESATAKVCIHAERSLTWAARRMLDIILNARPDGFRPV